MNNVRSLTLSNGAILNVFHDDCAESPRNDDNLGTMVFWHRRYNLGDKHSFDIESFKEEITVEDNIVLPVYMMDHGSIALSTGKDAFRACDPHGWDWGLLGFIYVSKADAMRNFGVKCLTPDLVERTKDALRAEVAVYEDYVNGEVYGFSLENAGDDEHSVWGFIGWEHLVSGLQDHLPTKYAVEVVDRLSA